jgi:hypothetical protein
MTSQKIADIIITGHGHVIYRIVDVYSNSINISGISASKLNVNVFK